MQTFHSFRELESYLREWMSFADNEIYDAGGGVALLGACLDNLQRHLLEEDVEDLRERLSESQRGYLIFLAERLR